MNHIPQGQSQFAKFDPFISKMRTGNHQHTPCAICAFIYCLKHSDLEAADIIRKAQFDPCEVMVDLGQRCGKPATQTVSEPYTPGAIKIPCCDDCASDFGEQGYGWIKPTEFALEHPPIKALWEVQSERDAKETI